MTNAPPAGSLVGRDSELAVVTDVLAKGDSGLVLIIGAPGLGKRSMLREIRKQATGRLMVPGETTTTGAAPAHPDPNAQADRPEWLTVDGDTTIGDFLNAINSDPNDDSADVSSVGTQPPTVILIYGYHPTDAFNEWFNSYLSLSDDEKKRRPTIFLAGFPSDVKHLAPLAARVIELGPLPRQPVADRLIAINADITNKLDDHEIDAYSALICTDPSLLDALSNLLRLEDTGSVR
jgi:hypothetical protein